MAPLVIELWAWPLFILVVLSTIAAFAAHVPVVSVLTLHIPSVTLGFTRFVVVFILVILLILVLVLFLRVPLVASTTLIVVIVVLGLSLVYLVYIYLVEHSCFGSCLVDYVAGHCVYISYDFYCVTLFVCHYSRTWVTWCLIAHFLFDIVDYPWTYRCLYSGGLLKILQGVRIRFSFYRNYHLPVSVIADQYRSSILVYYH